MQKLLLREAEQYVKQNQRRRIWRKIVRTMACIVVFCTTYALILPAITMERTSCDLEEHTHSESCYEKVLSYESTTLNCTYETLAVHKHTPDCFDSEQNLLCGFADFLVHSHDGSCFDASGALVCRLPVVLEHEHTDSCYQTDAVHEHDDSCYIQERGELVCQLPESEGHTHEDDCYEQNSVLVCQEEDPSPTGEPELICGLEPVKLHRHDDGCYETYQNENGEEQKRLICQVLEVLAHVHGESCFVTEQVEAQDTETLTCTVSDEAHEHADRCYGTWELTCEKEEHTHTEECAPEGSEDPTEAENFDGPQIGDKVWINRGTHVYKTQTDENGWSLRGNYEVEIVDIITDDTGAVVMYEFEFTSKGLNEALLHGYKYVKASDITVEDADEVEPDEHACNCGENAPENLANHADSCPRKQYVKTLFEGKSAEEIYAAWYSYDEALRVDLLNMLQAWDNAKFQELQKLLETTPDAEKETTTGDVSMKLQGVPETAELSAETLIPQDFHEDLFEVIGSKKVVFAIDITLTMEETVWQPADDHSVTVTVDALSLGLAEGERIGILHDHDGTLNDLGVYTVTDGVLTFTTNGFSAFYGFTVDFEYDGTWHSIGGGSGIYLYELFARLGINKPTSVVTSVSFSDPSLIQVTREVVDGYTGEMDWYIQSLQPFTTEEIMTILFNDGSELIINVYDATYTSLSGNLTLNDGDIINGATISGNVNITLNGTVTISNSINIPAGASLTITGNGTLKRNASYIGNLFSVTGGTLTITGTNIIIDGGAVWTSSAVADSTREMLSVSVGASTTSAAIYVKDSGTVNLTSITMQNFYTTTKGQAPAIHVTGSYTDALHSTVNMTGVTVQNCATIGGQSITLFNDCIATLNGCTYLNNYSGGTYAGALKAGGPNYFSQLNMTNCVASGNYSSGWGGVLLWAANNECGSKSSKATIDGCTFTNNKARYLGGALSNEAIMEVKNTTITNNIGMAGGGIATFPFTLTETQTVGGNACGLTLGSGNVIEDNIAYASGDFTPFSSEEAGPNGDDAVIDNKITYTGGGGGVWCYMNKPGWTCSLNIGAGNTLNSNTANNVGGGVYVHNVASAGTTLGISGAVISGNTAINGGGVAVKDATVTIDSGEITANTATTNGGGIYVDNGTCTVSGTGSVSGNTAANGGGFYINNGIMNVYGGYVVSNSAVGTPSITTAYTSEANTGVGGGIYLHRGTFKMTAESEEVGLYGNTADFAADDVYAAPSGTTLEIPKVADMNLTNFGQVVGTVTDWFEDYAAADSSYESGLRGGGYTNSSSEIMRYRKADNEHKISNKKISATNQYICLTLGFEMDYKPVTIQKFVESNVPELITNGEFRFRVDYNNGISDVFTEFTLKDGESKVIEDVINGTTVTVTELNPEGYAVSVTVFDANDNKLASAMDCTISAANTAVNDKGITIVFTNYTGYELPDTGGAGTYLYTMGGALLMAAAILLYIHNLKRRKEARHSF